MRVFRKKDRFYYFAIWQKKPIDTARYSYAQSPIYLICGSVLINTPFIIL